MTQSKLGHAVGLTFQQIQKYERGADRISSSRLFEFAKVLDVSIDYFFDQMRSASRRGQRSPSATAAPLKDPLIERETFELVRAYYKVPKTRVRRGLVEMIKILGAASQANVLRGRRQRKLRG
jgi:transcriptional regulator with XRE-family HTH domain